VEGYTKVFRGCSLPLGIRYHAHFQMVRDLFTARLIVSLVRRRVASENTVIELLKAKCLPSLYYGLEACPINKSQIRSLEFVVNSLFKKIFSTKSYDVANECAIHFNCSVSYALYKIKVTFFTKLKKIQKT